MGFANNPEKKQNLPINRPKLNHDIQNDRKCVFWEKIQKRAGSARNFTKGFDMPIRKTKQGYKIANVAGTSPTKEKAIARLRAIKASQATKRKSK